MLWIEKYINEDPFEMMKQGIPAAHIDYTKIFAYLADLIILMGKEAVLDIQPSNEEEAAALRFLEEDEIIKKERKFLYKINVEKYIEALERLLENPDIGPYYDSLGPYSKVFGDKLIQHLKNLLKD